MKKKTYKLKHMAGAFFAGAMLFSGFSLAAANPEGAVDAIKHATSKISYYVNGKDHSTPAGQFMNQGTAAPDSIIHNSTTYVPVRMVSDLVGQPVYWEQASRTISLGLPVVNLYN
ncbi:superoxide dismutase family protein, partial [Clostridium perfringens]